MKRVFILLALALALTGCKDLKDKLLGSPPEKTLNISWEAHPAAEVNQAGGGYWVYVSPDSNPNANNAHITLELPFDGTSAPTSAKVDLASGDWYVGVQAYGNLHPNGGGIAVYGPVTIK